MSYLLKFAIERTMLWTILNAVFEKHRTLFRHLVIHERHHDRQFPLNLLSVMETGSRLATNALQAQEISVGD